MGYEIWGKSVLGSLHFKADVSEFLLQASILQQCAKLVISFVYTRKKCISIHPPLPPLKMIDNNDTFCIIKEIVHPTIKILSLSNCSRVVENLYDLLCVDHKRYLYLFMFYHNFFKECPGQSFKYKWMITGAFKMTKSQVFKWLTAYIWICSLHKVIKWL